MIPKECREHEELFFRDEVFQIIGAALNVANGLGCGFL